jgi:hypothetical protein
MLLRWKAFDGNEAPLGVIYGAVLAGCAAPAALWIRMDLPRIACPLRELSGVPCPTCGSTRMVEAFLRGDLNAAFASNPLVFLALTGVAAWAIASTLRRVFSWPAPQVVCNRRERLLARVAVVALVLSGWAWVIVRP